MGAGDLRLIVAAPLSNRQAFALVEELHSATKLMDLGVAELHKLNLANDFYHLPMQLLAQGIERFLKLTYAMACQRESGDMPRRDAIRKYGHRLVLLADALVGVAERSPDYVRRRAVQDDLEFIRANEGPPPVVDLSRGFWCRGPISPAR